MSKKYLKSPFNYIGNKHKLLPQILPLFPKDINIFVDLFCGGLDVTINTIAKNKIANDINHFVIDIMRLFQKENITILLEKINRIIAENKLSKYNKENYYKFRKKYNKNKDPLSLYVLVCYSFNYQFRFNSDLEYNNSAGTNRSSFNDNMRKRLIDFTAKLGGVQLINKNFKDIDLSMLTKKDFVYADPPYRVSTGSYNDGKRGFEGWSLEDDLILFDMLDFLDKCGIKFALSNVLENNGSANKELTIWSKKYNIHYLNNCYSNSNYQRKREGETTEVLIMNY